MAARFPSKDNRVQFKTRKGHDMTWSCDKHGEPISFCCKKHKVCICHKCATKDHGQKPCELEDIEDVIFEMKGKIDETLLQIEDGQKHLERMNSEMLSCETLVKDHLKAVNQEVKSAFEYRMQKAKDREREEIRLINEEAVEEIRIINEKRDKRIRELRAEIEMQEKAITEKQSRVMSETTAIGEVVANKVEGLKRENKLKIDTMNTMVNKINRMKQDDKTLVDEAPSVVASVTESYNANSLQDVTNCLDRIKNEIQRVRFVEGEVGGQRYARIDGYLGKWELAKSVDIVPAALHLPLVCGVISDDEVCVIDKGVMHVTNTNTSHTDKVIDGGTGTNPYYMTSCIPLDSNTLICEKGVKHCKDESMDECITLYDRQWELVRHISMPKDPGYPGCYVLVDVDKEGMILAAESHQRNIYVINPVDGKVVHTVTLDYPCKVRDAIQALSSGDILLQTDGGEFTVISRSGKVQFVMHVAEWYEWSKCRVDKLTDTLYITHWDKERHLYSVDQASSDGHILAKRIVEFEILDPACLLTPCLSNPSGNLVTCNGRDKILVYKKIFSI